jgi:ABC-type transport system involved in cytochrome bd biosynthesis fused ATPase/permease subunit
MGNIDEKKSCRKDQLHPQNATGVHDAIDKPAAEMVTKLSIGNLFDDSRELSWGEWQKIALARALFRDAPVLILDEPSSALDADTEYDIFSQIQGDSKRPDLDSYQSSFYKCQSGRQDNCPR